MKIAPSVVTLLLLSRIAVANPDSAISVRGTVVGSDGKPMRAAVVILSRVGARDVKHPAGPDGGFSFAPPEPGAYTLYFMGVHHKTIFLPVFVDRPRTIEVHVRLSASTFRQTLSDVRVIGDFNKFSTESGSIALNPQPDGTFAATVDWQGDLLSYQVQGALKADDTVCGTQADSYELERGSLVDNSDNQFVSVIKGGRRPVRIVFDPRQLPRSPAGSDVRFSDPTIPAARVAAIYRDFRAEHRRYQTAMAEYVAQGHDRSTFKYDFSEAMRRLEGQIRTEADPFLKQYLILTYFQLPSAKSNVELAKHVFTEVPPDSWAWSLVWGGPENLFRRIAQTAQMPADEERYLTSAYEANPDRDTRAAFLYVALRNASARKDVNTVGRLYTRLMGDFGDSAYASDAVVMAPNRNVQEGKPVPDFAFVSLDDGSTLTPKTLLGKTYLIDFWAVWCGPCVAEMKNLHAAYERFKDKGLVLVSVSLDEKLSDVLEFRKTKWPLPWFSARLPGFDSETVRAFEIVGIPKVVLVGGDGKILAIDEGLRGEKLAETLARVFGQLK